MAVDGETSGHHSRFGEMALAWALDRLTQEGDVRVTNFAEYLSPHPPDWEAHPRGTRRGAAPTASSAGAPTGAARPAGCRAGTKPGARRCGTRWTG
ncbi:MAG: hypothetical protein M5U09_30530 [Gammaproteobacteria bacterium]|nr:hypothetical protein [Gammaproteobacteria bacterium]